MKKKTFEDLDLEIEQLDFEKDALLRKAGWEQTSHTPGCLWLWKRKIGSETYLVNQSAAIAITLWLEFHSSAPQEAAMGGTAKNLPGALLLWGLTKDDEGVEGG